VLVQSENRPDWLRVDPSYFVDDPTCKKMPAIAWQVGARLRFRLRANPTRRARSVSLAPDGGPLDARWVGKRIGLRREEDQIAWLHRKAGEGGFQVASVIVSPEANDRSRRAGATVTQTAVRFDGVLVITDPSRFQQSVDLGIGSSKGFGFGLLSVGNLTD
jgi:CRISPR system Cascade subunit CasE